MRVGLFTDTYLPDINGVVSSVELLRKKLVEEGHDVYVICTYPGVLKVQHEGNLIRLPGVEFKKLYGYAVASPLHFFLYDEIEALHLDIIHAHTEFGVGIFAQMCADHFHIPLVRTYHTTYEDYTHYANPMNSETVDEALKKLVANLSKQFGQRCMYLISPSLKTKEMLLGYGIKTPIKIIPTGTELKRFDSKNTSEERIKEIREELHIRKGNKMMLYVGRIAQEKSLDMLIDAFKEVKNANLNIQLAVIGGGPDLEHFNNLIKKYELEEYVYFANKRENSMIPSYYHAADCFASASTTETQGMTYIEALASGLPIFARRDECVEDILFEGEDGFYFDDSHELFTKIQEFLTYDETKVESMAEFGKSKVAQYDADIFAQNILNIYVKAISEYHKYYLVESIRLKNDYVLLKTINHAGQTEEINISLEKYYDIGIRKGAKLSLDVVDELKENEIETLVYRACLRRIATKDYTIKQMYDYIGNKHDLSIAQTNHVIDRLIERGLLDDKKYAISKYESMNNKFHSARHIVNALRKDGVPADIIESVVITKVDDETKKAIKVAEKYQSKIRNKSLNMKKQMIVKHMLDEGFEMDVVKEAVLSLDFNEDVYLEKDVLRREAIRLKARYEKKYQGSTLRNRIFNALASKGFNYDAIYAILNEMEWDDE